MRRPTNWSSLLYPANFFAAVAVCLLGVGFVFLTRPGVSIDVTMHDTYSVVTSAHIYFLLAGYFGMFAGIYGLFLEADLPWVHRILGHIHFAISVGFALVVVAVLHHLGMEHGRDPGELPFRELFVTQGRILVYASMAFFLAHVIFFANVTLRLLRRPPA